MNRRALFRILLVARLGVHPVRAQYLDRSVPYVPTPDDIVRQMLTMADVTAADTLYDLGCGDGRIVIMAAKEFGASGVGYEISPKLVKRSRANAEAAGVGDTAVFREGDIFEVDISEPTVVALYLLPHVNIMLRPRLLNELRPGTRVVSHNFDMDEWRPDKSKDMGAHKILCWIVPANVTGTWRWTGGPDGGTGVMMTVEQKYQRFTATAVAGETGLAVGDGWIAGPEVSFTLGDGANGGRRYHGRVAGDIMEGSYTTADGTGILTFRAQRDPGTSRRLTMLQSPGCATYDNITATS